MQENNYLGKFIVFEGLDGSGQSTQTGLLKDFLIRQGYSVILTKEPTLNSAAGKKIREVLDKKIKLKPEELQKLFAQDRKEHFKKEIIPALKKGKIVISDRYFFSSFAFGSIQGLDLNWLIELNKQFLTPDLIFILKVRPEICIKRIKKRGKPETFFETKEKLQKVWQNYKKFPDYFKEMDIRIINGEKTIEKIFKIIKKITIQKLFMNINKITKSNRQKLSKKKIAEFIDHTNIKIGATADDIKKTCLEAKKYKFRGVCINPEWVKLVKKELTGTDIHPVKSCEAGILPKAKLFNRAKVVVLIDPPMGLSPHSQRIKMCQKAKKDGADELDPVMNIVDLKYERYDKVFKDLRAIAKILPTKVIIGSGYLTNEEIKKASEIVKKAGAICVKTATFNDPLDNFELKEKARHLKIMKKFAPGLLIKASGAINNLKDAKLMIKAGADIIGTSSGVEIIRGISKKKKKGEY